MPNPPEFDLEAAHRHFAADCFNSAWDLIEKKDRTVEDDQMMVAMSYASIFHWAQRADCDNQKMAVGYWQASRIQCLVGNAAEALRLGDICMSFSRFQPPFFLAYAHEALARAHSLLGENIEAAEHLAAARELLPQVEDEESRDQLAADLRQLY